jgi:hypothetical protein
MAVDELALPGQTHSANFGLDLISPSLGAFQFNNSAIHTDVATEELKCLAVLLHLSIAFGVRIVEGAETHVAKFNFSFVEDPRTLDFPERKSAKQGTGGELGDNRKFLGIATMLACFRKSKGHCEYLRTKKDG